MNGNVDILYSRLDINTPFPTTYLFTPRRNQNNLTKTGDFSFTRALATQYRCRNLCATCYDSKETLLEKYPQAESNIQDILQSGKTQKKQRTETESADSKEKKQTNGDDGDDDEKKTEKDTQQGENTTNTSNINNSSTGGPKVLFSIDARKLGSATGGGKEIRTGFPRKERKRPAWQTTTTTTTGTSSSSGSPSSRGGPWDVICFNFPHVGGLSTDVNRQVRANQELLVAFFKACVPLLSTAPEQIDDDDDEWEETGDESWLSSSSEENDEEEIETSGKGTRSSPGQILVSLFEAEPYTLWNIKDLARHAGLRVVTSFRFPWSSYQGYSHARTIGEIEGKDGGRGGWRGEDRDARMYVFEVKPEEKQETTGKTGKKRVRDDSDSE